MPKDCSRSFSIYLPQLLTEMDVSTSQEITDLFVPAKCAKTSPNPKGHTVSEPLHLLTAQVDQLRLTSEQALEQTKPLIRTFPLANMKQFQYLHAVQQYLAQFFVDLDIEKREHLKLYITIRQFEDELVQMRRKVNEPSSSSLPVYFTVDAPCSTTFQDKCALNNAQKSKPVPTITLKGASDTSSKPKLPEKSRSPPAIQPTPGPSLDLEPRTKQLEEEMTKAKNCRETIISNYRSQFTFPYDRYPAMESGSRDIILWKITSLRLVFDTAKYSIRLDDAAKDHSTHYNSPLFRTNPYGFFLVQLYPYGLDAAAGTNAWIMFAFFPGDYDGLLTWPFPKNISSFSSRSTQPPK